MNDLIRALLADAGAEATRLAERVDELTEELSVAEAEHALIADWPVVRIDLIRTALQRPRFADMHGYRAELERAEAELAAVQELRRRLAGEHT